MSFLPDNSHMLKGHLKYVVSQFPIQKKSKWNKQPERELSTDMLCFIQQPEEKHKQLFPLCTNKLQVKAKPQLKHKLLFPLFIQLKWWLVGSGS